MRRTTPHYPFHRLAIDDSTIHYSLKIIKNGFNPSCDSVYTVSTMRIYGTDRKLTSKLCYAQLCAENFISFAKFAGIPCVATFPIVKSNSTRCLLTKAITIRCIDSCVASVKSICPVRICSIYICQRRMTHSLPFKLTRSQW